MDFVQAKAILEKFAHTYKAAEFMADALETAVALERRAMELQNNVEHLAKQQTGAQARLAEQERFFSEMQTKQAQQQAERLVRMRNEAERVQESLAHTRAKVEEDITAAQARLIELTRRGDEMQRSLDSQIAAKQQEVEKLTASVEALKAQARQVLN